jgi:hypothetical protein
MTRDRDALKRLIDYHSRFTVEAACGDHAEQLAFVRDRSSNWIHLVAARQSGKSFGCDTALLDQGFHAPATTNVLLGIKGTGVKINNWTPIWKPMCERWGVDEQRHNETTMLTTFANRARVMFAGTDDLANVKKYLGNNLANSLIIVDECQDQPDGVLRYIVKVMLPPMIHKTTRVVLAGVLPDVPAGFFYELIGPGGRSPPEVD